MPSKFSLTSDKVSFNGLLNTLEIIFPSPESLSLNTETAAPIFPRAFSSFSAPSFVLVK